MKYNIMKFNGTFLELIKKDVLKHEFSDFGEIDRPIYSNYGESECGFLLLKGNEKFYALISK